MSDNLKKQIEPITERYPNKRSAIMPALYLAQQKYKYLSGEVLKEVADILDVPEIWVFELASFYTMFHTEPIGKFHIQVCTNISCLVRQAENLLEAIEKHLEIGSGETTRDGLFTISKVECIGACDKAPALMINQDYYENMDVQRVEDLLVELAKTEEH